MKANSWEEMRARGWNRRYHAEHGNATAEEPDWLAYRAREYGWVLGRWLTARGCTVLLLL